MKNMNNPVSSSTSPARSSMMPLALFLLVLVAGFYLIRPPALIFWHYVLGMGDDQATFAEGADPFGSPDKNTGARTAALPPMKPPPIPTVLFQGWAPAPQRPKAITELEEEIHALTVHERTRRGKTALDTNPGLVETAAWHSHDMFAKNYHGHVSPEGIGPGERIGKLHRRLFGVWAENVAFRKGPESGQRLAAWFVQGWMNSMGHRRNILNDGMTHLGVGCFGKKDQGAGATGAYYCTQVFAEAYGWSEQPIPAEMPIGTEIAIRLRPEAGKPLATRISQVSLKNDKTLASANLTARAGVASGNLRVRGPTGAYRLSIHVPDTNDANRYFVVSGPYIVIK
uniref:Uncharacterized conserved protein YkwD, contains CAP (CSP/antigen 5/PR1) domain n=1 Tax=Candidatus Kentrum sp. MB TaxID=2138164 RepID=A0A450XA06_9GAMM|nr:MAG: Uncharacterized conserved protein YkwD, contains CAP (CSP/antigen 5/PR1) domain [Candidatus Kentron sp. MB]